MKESRTVLNTSLGPPFDESILSVAFVTLLTFLTWTGLIPVASSGGGRSYAGGRGLFFLRKRGAVGIPFVGPGKFDQRKGTNL